MPNLPSKSEVEEAIELLRSFTKVNQEYLGKANDGAIDKKVEDALEVLYIVATAYTSGQLAEVKPMMEEEVWDILIKVHGCKPRKEDCCFEKCHHWGICEGLARALSGKITEVKPMMEEEGEHNDIEVHDEMTANKLAEHLGVDLYIVMEISRWACSRTKPHKDYKCPICGIIQPDNWCGGCGKVIEP